MKNKNIAYDFHGDLSLTTAFDDLKRNQISIYLDLDTKVGRDTCGQKCAHCWFVNYEKVRNKSFDLEEGKAIYQSLQALDYQVYPRYVDSFAYGGKFMEMYGVAHNREFRQGEGAAQTETMVGGDAWTSGTPLLADDYMKQLDIAYDAGYRTISITFHGTIDENGHLIDHKHYPIKGVLRGKDCERVIRRIKSYSSNKAAGAGFRVNIGITIGKHNHSKEMLIRYAHYFNTLGVATVRFNNFSDHSGKHAALVLSQQEIVDFYRHIKQIHQTIPLHFQLAVSEDFGSDGIEVMGFPPHVGWCRSGHQLFAIIPSEEIKRVEVSAQGEQQTKIGDIVGCVNVFEPNFGALIRCRTNDTVTYKLQFDSQKINAFNQARVQGVYQNGCYSKALMKRLQHDAALL